MLKRRTLKRKTLLSNKKVGKKFRVTSFPLPRGWQRHETSLLRKRCFINVQIPVSCLVLQNSKQPKISSERKEIVLNFFVTLKGRAKAAHGLRGFETNLIFSLFWFDFATRSVGSAKSFPISSGRCCCLRCPFSSQRAALPVQCCQSLGFQTSREPFLLSLTA